MANKLFYDSLTNYKMDFDRLVFFFKAWKQNRPGHSWPGTVILNVNYTGEVRHCNRCDEILWSDCIMTTVTGDI